MSSLEKKLEAILSLLSCQTVIQEPNFAVQDNSGAVGGVPVPETNTPATTAPKIPLPEKYDG